MSSQLTFHVQVTCEDHGEIIAEYEADIGHRINGEFPNPEGDDITDECRVCSPDEQLHAA